MRIFGFYILRKLPEWKPTENEAMEELRKENIELMEANLLLK